jgi:hypothetical protein
LIQYRQAYEGLPIQVEEPFSGRVNESEPAEPVHREHSGSNIPQDIIGFETDAL